ncbi:hypothetical protein [Andreprevotia lacus]|nr:hypothetical protein [Andreprevotia lacus]
MPTLPRLTALLLCCALSLSLAADAPLNLRLQGGGRACSGGLFVRDRTLEWHSSFSTCRSTPYRVLARTPVESKAHYVLALQRPSAHCFYRLIELEQVGEFQWNATGYQHYADYEHRDDPAWLQGDPDGRNTLSCPMHTR